MLMRLKALTAETKLKAVCALVLFAIGRVCATPQQVDFRIEKLMTPQELKETGVANLTEQQRAALSRWLLRYTMLVASTARNLPKAEGTPQTGMLGRFACIPTIESTISGEFEGWSGETIFKLDNGQIWQQAEYKYMYSYRYRPDVTIYATTSGCRMKVEGEEETILVKRLK
jgi:hypothetical protein